MARSTTYWGPVHRITPDRVVILIGCALLILAAELGGAPRLHSPVPLASTTHAPFAPILAPRPLRERFAVELSSSDIAHYQAAFSAQQQTDWTLADTHIDAVEEKILVADLLAQRYLHARYVSEYSQLANWLAQHSDHPSAARIHALALRKHSAAHPLPQAPFGEGQLRGYGSATGIGAATRPQGWRTALTDYEAGHYTKAAARFSNIAKATPSKWYRSAAHFWAARALTQSQQPVQAKQALEQASLNPHSLYGMLARQQLGQNLVEDAYGADASRAIYDTPALARASAWMQLERPQAAEAELRHLYVYSDRASREQLVHIAAALELPALQLRISQALWYNSKRHHAGDYPLPTWKPANQEAATSRSLLFAIVRQESAFNTHAKSASGASGLMQIMPDTARYIIAKKRLDEVRVASADGSFPRSRFTLENLQQPEVNLAIGAHYVDYLAAKPYIDGNLIYSLAAYNAGPGSLHRWVKGAEGEVNDPLLFIERIPFKETRHYVQQVLANYLMYHMLEQGNTAPIDTLLAGEWLGV